MYLYAAPHRGRLERGRLELPQAQGRDDDEQRGAGHADARGQRGDVDGGVEDLRDRELYTSANR